MGTTQFLKTRVSAETKRRVQQLAEQQLLTESIWLRQVTEAALRGAGSTAGEEHQPAQKSASSTRIYVRLRVEDQLLLRERASARGMPAATYLSVLTRAHLRRLTPLPKAELVALKRSIAELSAIGRNLNQIARAANSNANGSLRTEDLRTFLKVCQGLRDHVKALIKANVSSWEDGYVAGND